MGSFRGSIPVITLCIVCTVLILLSAFAKTEIVAPNSQELYKVITYEDDFLYKSLSDLNKNWYIVRTGKDLKKTLILDNGLLYVIENAKESVVALFLRNVDLRDYVKWEVDVIFKIIPTDKPPADGFLILFFHEPKIGEKGGALGIDNTKGYAIEFDIYKNDDHNDPTVPHISFMSGGADHEKNEIYRYKVNAPILGRWLYVKLVLTREKRVGNTIWGLLTLYVWNNADTYLNIPKGELITYKTIKYTFDATYGLLGILAVTGGQTSTFVVDWLRFRGYVPTTGQVTVVTTKTVTKTVTKTSVTTKLITKVATRTIYRKEFTTITETKIKTKTHTVTLTLTVATPKTFIKLYTVTKTELTTMTKYLTKTYTTTKRITLTSVRTVKISSGVSREAYIASGVILLLGVIIGAILRRR